MKILSLHLKNINCFRGDIHLDFTSEPLGTASLFAITGPTGSGKTTLLDAISVALYNRTPRLDGTGNSNPRNLLSQGEREGFSEVTFQVNDTPYTAEWRARRTRTGEIDTRVKLIRADTGELLTDRRKGKKGQDMRDLSVEEAITRILGMDFSAFKRSILLAQGEFASFLKADAEKKREILEVTTGMDIFDTLKNNLNQQLNKVKNEYDQAMAGLETIPQSSPEDIQAAQDSLLALDKRLKLLNENMGAIVKKKEIEQRRLDAHTRLMEARTRRQELLSRQEEMEHTRYLIQRAQKAVSIRSELDSYLEEEKQLEKLQTALDETAREKEDVTKQFGEAKQSFETIDQEFETARQEAQVKKKTLDQAAVYETQSKNLLEEADKKHQEADAVKAGMDELSVKIREKNDTIGALETELDKDRLFMEQHPLPDDAESVLADISKLSAALEEKKRVLEQHKKTLTKKESEYQKHVEEENKLIREGEILESDRTRILARMDTISRELEPLKSEGDEQYWSSMGSAWAQVRDVASRFRESYQQLRSIFDGDMTLTPSIRDFNHTLDSFNDRIELLNSRILAAEEKVKLRETEEQLVHAKNQALILRRNHLKPGAPCPVCGSTDHPLADEIIPGKQELLQEAEDNVLAAKAELETARTDLESIHNELTRQARDRINMCNQKLESIRSLSEAMTAAKSDLKLADKQIEGNNSQKEAHMRRTADLKQELQELSASITEIENDISKTSTRFFDLIPAEFRQDAPGVALEKFRQYIQSIRQCWARFEENSKTLEGLRTFVTENDKHLQAENNRYEGLLSSAVEYSKKGHRLQELVMEMTGGLGVEAARSSLDDHLKELEKQRNDRQEQYNQAGTRLTAISTRLESLHADLTRMSDKRDAARARYMQALERSGFQSIEEHRASFKEPAWLDENMSIIEEYQQDLHAAGEIIKTHEEVFAHRPFNPDDLPDILDEEQTLRTQIQELNASRGALQTDIKTLTENLKKRQQQENKIEGARLELERWQKLDELMPANRLRDFALEAMFDLLIRFANRQLADITSRYALKALNMKDMVVIDLWNAGEERPVETLSGGESFLVSLSLALALSELSQGRSRLESLFLDEGFGTLDPETLDGALYALESLRLTGRTIGVISHIDQLTRRIPVRIEVKKLGNGASGIHVKG